MVQQAKGQKALRTLEFDKILDKLSALAMAEETKDRCKALIPVSNTGEVKNRLAETTAAKELIGRKGSPSIASVKNKHAALVKADKGAVLSMRDLLDIAQILNTARSLRTYIEDGREGAGDLAFIFDQLRPNRSLEERITFAIVSEEEINDHASSELADIRRTMRNTAGKAREILNKLSRSQTYAKYLQDQIVTMRGDRFVIPVRAEYRNEIPGIIHDMSSSGATVFIEPMGVVEANNEMRTLVAREQAEIERILSELSAAVADYKEGISACYEMILDIDFIFAKAKLSYQMNAMEPAVNDRGYMQLNKARHPLIDPKKVVPIDVRLGEDFQTLVITGPNTGGKTVTLKTLGLLVLMAEAGLHIPAADLSEVSVFDHVLSDIGDEQSIEQSLSTFSAHMTNIVQIMDEVDSSSLVLFDELGAGTDPVEGAALAIAILERCAAFGAKVAATTHYAELKAYALQTKGVENASCEFDVATLKPTYKLLIGTPGKSNAFAISGRLGLDSSVIDRAEELIGEENRKFEDVLTDLEQKRQEMEKATEKAEQLRRAQEKTLAETEKEKERFDREKDREVQKARDDARRMLSTVKGMYARVMDELEALQKEKDTKDFKDRLRTAKKDLQKQIERAEDQFEVRHEKKDTAVYQLPRPLQTGDYVYIKSINKNGTVITLPDSKGELMVQAGILKLRVHQDTLRLEERPDPNAELKAKYKTSLPRSGGAPVKRELDLRGMTGDEAILEIDRYLDSAMLMNVGEVVLIHGKGTGALRNAVRDHLKRHPHVKSSRRGLYGEGEDGVTVVTVK